MAWLDRMNAKYGKKYPWIAQKLTGKEVKINETQLCNVYDGAMNDKAKERYLKTPEAIDKMAEKLLGLGFRIVKSSAITPKGEFSRTSRPQQIGKPTFSNMFYEQQFNRKEFKRLYDRLGRYENNFPNYFTKEDSFDDYAKTHDIWVLENVETGKPVAFSSFRMMYDEEERKLYGAKDGQRAVYHDTLAMSPELQGLGVSKLFDEICYSTVLSYYGKDTVLGLCTGDINTNDKNQLSKGFHELMGFGGWVVSQRPLKRFMDRQRELASEYGSKMPEEQMLMVNSYLGKEIN